MRILLVIPPALLLAACSPAGADQVPPPLPSTIEDSMLGVPTFDERFDRFDVGTDQIRGSAPHRWRTVMGYGDATAFDNRKLSDTSVAVDPDFPGVENNSLGSTPLGLNPFEHSPGKSMSIVARPIPPALQPKMWNAKYYSGQITTRFSFSQRYGYFEIEAILPAGKGFWPQFWLLPMGGNWPSGGEIDVLEGLGDPHAIFTTLHWGDSRKDHKSAQKKIALPFDASSGFHRYGVGWSPENIVWYVDRKEVMRVETPEEVKDPMFILLGLGVGGPWGGYPDKATVFPGRYVIRRVQAWSLPES